MRARAISVLVPAATLLTLPFSLACRAPSTVPPPSTDPGTTYAITGALTDNSCAPGFDPVNPLVFAASFRNEGSIAYWRVGEQVWIPGTLGRDGDFHFTLRTDVEVYPATPGTDPDLDPGSPGCVITMVESIDGRFVEVPAGDAGIDDAGDAGPSDAGQITGDAGDAGNGTVRVMDATNRIELVPFAGTECSRALLVNGGSFPSLPCSATYVMEGEP
jgi:hypothetical protein